MVLGTLGWKFTCISSLDLGQVSHNRDLVLYTLNLDLLDAASATKSSPDPNLSPHNRLQNLRPKHSVMEEAFATADHLAHSLELKLFRHSAGLLVYCYEQHSSIT